MELTGFGGIEEVGGNSFLLDDGKSKILLDCGLRFGEARFLRKKTGAARQPPPPGNGDFFEAFMGPSTHAYIPLAMRMGLLRGPREWYRNDVGGAAGAAPALDGIVISHAHLDHVGHLPFLDVRTPVATSDTTRAILGWMDSTGDGLTSEYVRYTPRDLPTRSRTSKLAKEVIADETVNRDFAPSANFGAFSVTSFSVDHSIPGATGFVLDHPDAQIAYTGDLRIHGRDPHLSQNYLQKAAGVDVLIIEGTNVGGHEKNHQNDSEQSVEDSVLAEIRKFEKRKDFDGFVFVGYPFKDTDRLLSLYNVARECGRRLVLQLKFAKLLLDLRAVGVKHIPDPTRDPNIAILHADNQAPAMPKDLGLVPSTRAGEFKREKEYVDFGEAYPHFAFTEYQDLAANPREFLIGVSTYSLAIFPILLDSSRATISLYIHSLTQPFNDEMDMRDEKLNFWLNQFKLERFNTHVSGHLSQTDLEYWIDAIGAKTLIPIHSQNAAYTAEQYRARTGLNYILPSWDTPVKIA